ncbi:MAG: tetratricopeptide repeat protein [SAR324 cluster bacterium]|nr:tetratricopeptide repeat protein [SAR324 cluster bacterium]
MRQFRKYAAWLLLTGGLAGCSSSAEEVESAPKVSRQTIYNQFIDGGKSSISVLEETIGGKKQIRIVLKKEGVDSSITHPIDNPNFVIAVPLHDPTSARVGIQTIDFENEKRRLIEELLLRYIPRDRFNVSIKLFWDEKRLEELQLKGVPFQESMGSTQPVPTASTKAPDKLNYELEQAVIRQETRIMLDNTLPAYQEKFVRLLLPSQTFFVKSRGDTATVERVIFPKASPESIAPEEERLIREKVQKMIQEYLSQDDFVVNVRLSMKGGQNIQSITGQGDQISVASMSTATDQVSDRMNININVLLNDLTSPDTDEFLRNTIPYAIHMDMADGDQLTITRKRFPEKDYGQISPQQVAQLEEYKREILTAFESGNYAGGLDLVKKAMKISVKRDDRLSLLKMQGSLYFLLQDKQRARETWEHLIKLDPENEEAKQMLMNLVK